MHTGQNSIGSESPLPQTEQVRWVFVLMHLTVLQPPSESKATHPPSNGAKSSLRHPLRMMVQLQLQASVWI
jgi:hypothetical protein